MSLIVALLAGLVFGAGLVLSGMFDPAKVLGFLDLAGPWDPSLAVVMCTAIPVAALAYAIVRRRGVTLLATPLHLPSARHIDAPLVLGSLTFGVGWGLAGLCPAPALVVLGAGRAEGVWFVAAMLVGMGAHLVVERLRHPPTDSPVQQH